MSDLTIPDWARRDQIPVPIVPTDWRKSSFCEATSCVEVGRRFDGDVLIRNSQHPAYAIRFTQVEWAAFIEGLTHGEFRHLLAPVQRVQ